MAATQSPLELVLDVYVFVSALGGDENSALLLDCILKNSGSVLVLNTQVEEAYVDKGCKPDGEYLMAWWSTMEQRDAITERPSRLDRKQRLRLQALKFRAANKKLRGLDRYDIRMVGTAANSASGVLVSDENGMTAAAAYLHRALSVDVVPIQRAIQMVCPT